MSEKTPRNGDFCWNELQTTDSQKAAEFYKNLLDWQSNDITMENGSYTIFKNHDNDIAGMMQIASDMKNQISSHWTSYIMVDNLDTIVTKAEKLGAKVQVPITEAGDMGRLAIVQDPTGANIAFWQPNKT